MATTETQVQIIRYEYYVMFMNTLFDADAHDQGIVTELEDVRVCTFLEGVWADTYLYRWLTSGNKLGTPVSEPHFLSLLGWMQGHDFFAFGVSKARLALYLSEHFPTVKDWNERSMQQYLSQRPSKEIGYRLTRLKRAMQGVGMH